MDCPNCAETGHVLNVRSRTNDPSAARELVDVGPYRYRRYECPACKTRWSTAEVYIEILERKTVKGAA